MIEKWIDRYKPKQIMLRDKETPINHKKRQINLNKYYKETNKQN